MYIFSVKMFKLEQTAVDVSMLRKREINFHLRKKRYNTLNTGYTMPPKMIETVREIDILKTINSFSRDIVTILHWS